MGAAMAELDCFVIMPFDRSFDAVYQAVTHAVKDAVAGQAIHCYWLKDVHAAGKITDDILSSLQNATLCIADLTGNNPNVMWETGYAMALGKPTILIGQSVSTLPFDLKIHRVIEYAPGELHKLEEKLIKSIRETLERYAVSPTFSTNILDSIQQPTIAVTGSMRASPALLRQRVNNLLQPYVKKKTIWYCGSNGNTDEAVLEYLVAHKQQVVAVGYNRYDLSARVRQLVDENQVGFVDASLEYTPKGLSGPSKRDVLFMMKADLVILFWDGESRGIFELIDYYQNSGKSYLVGYI